MENLNPRQIVFILLGSVRPRRQDLRTVGRHEVGGADWAPTYRACPQKTNRASSTGSIPGQLNKGTFICKRIKVRDVNVYGIGT